MRADKPACDNSSRYGSFQAEDFSRQDDRDDTYFYSTDRFVEHLDTLALQTVEKLIGELITEKRPVILDLMASWDSHIPGHLRPLKVVGLGLNENELAANPDLSEFIIHDLNRDPVLPLPSNHFDCVLNTVSVDYMTKPVEVFREVRRILKPGGLFLVIFSNRYFPQKAIRIWRQSSEPERVLLVEDFFEVAGGFEESRRYVSRGRPRPDSDKYAHLRMPSDPIYAVYADKTGGASSRGNSPTLHPEYGGRMDRAELRKRTASVKENLRCPYCNEKMKKWAVSQTPFSEWDNEFMYICFNDFCPYFVRGWDAMERQGNTGLSYRCMYNPIKDRCMPIPVPGPNALKDGIIE